ncbi:MAG: hypothetical protein ACJAZ1_000404 [Yoonia sp.]
MVAADDGQTELAFEVINNLQGVQFVNDKNTTYVRQQSRPSSKGLGASHVRISVSQPLRINSAPIAVITAVGSLEYGTTTNHGRAGFSQNRVKNPVT